MVLGGFFKRSFILSIAFIISVGAILPLLVLPVNAANINDATPTDEAKSASYFRTLRTCINNEMNTTIQLSASDNGVAKPSKWFSENDTYGYVFPEGRMDCKDIAPKALSLWGWGSDYSSFLKILGFTYNASDAKWTVANRDLLRNKFDSAVQEKYYGFNFAGNPTQSGAARYEMFANAFTVACGAKDLGAMSSITNASYKAWLNDSTADKGTQVSGKTANVPGTKTGSYVYFAKVDVVENINGQPTKVSHGYAYQSADAIDNPNWGSNDKVKLYGYHNDAVERSCHEIQKGVTENAGASLAWAKLHPSVVVTPPGSPDATAPGVENPTASSCTVEGVGWIVCPVLTFMGGIVDGAYNFVSGLLVVQPLLTTGDSIGTYQAWVVMRNIANVAFVIAFLIIIFSQLTGVALSNYGVKKLLPRLVVAAILVNVSFWVCAIAIDISNIVGASIVTIFDSVGTNISSNLSGVVNDDGNLQNGGEWTDLVGGVIAGGTAGLVAYYVGLSALIPALLAAVVAIVTVFLVLTLRQALIILLIVISPLAFVAYLLPNTEDLFTKWRKLFTTLLLMYPIIAGLFGASALASMIVMRGAGDNTVIAIMGACIAILPLAITPLVMKTAGGVLNRFGGIVNNTERGPIDRLKKAGAGYREGRNNLRNTKALNGSYQLGRGGFVQWRARRSAISSGRQSEASRTTTGYVADQIQNNASFQKSVAGGSLMSKPSTEALQRAEASAIGAQLKLEADEVNAASAIIKNANLDLNQMQELAMGRSLNYNAPDGTAKTLQNNVNSTLQMAAIKEQFKIGDIGMTDKIISESAGFDVKQRQTISEGAQSLAGKVKYYGGTTGTMIAKGEIHNDAELDVVVKQTMEAGKFSEQDLAVQDKDALARFARVGSMAGVDNSKLMKVAQDLQKNDRIYPMVEDRKKDRITKIAEGKPF